MVKTHNYPCKEQIEAFLRIAKVPKEDVDYYLTFGEYDKLINSIETALQKSLCYMYQFPVSTYLTEIRNFATMYEPYTENLLTKRWLFRHGRKEHYQHTLRSCGDIDIVGLTDDEIFSVLDMIDTNAPKEAFKHENFDSIYDHWMQFIRNYVKDKGACSGYEIGDENVIINGFWSLYHKFENIIGMGYTKPKYMVYAYKSFLKNWTDYMIYLSKISFRCLKDEFEE